ncbi:hypothetical protein HDU67_010028 [Dinochytrium kinnereticum]|nr:hypothetical protein HDU67_010028 [Dinochytrium kinnereticum]
MAAYASVNNMPAVDFSKHCSFPTDTFAGWPKTSISGLSLLNCPSIAKDIELCQSLGKKVILSINPMDGMVDNDINSPRYAATVAMNVWNIFLGGSSSTRPFGKAVLDGIDLHIWNNDRVGVELFVRTLKNLMGNNYLLAFSPRCMFPDYIFGPSTANVNTFDYLVPFFIQSSNVCGYRGNNPDGFWSTLQQWSSWSNNSSPMVPMALGLIGWPVEPWAQGSIGDYIPADDFATKDLVPRFRASSQSFNGFAIQDASFDSLNFPCYSNRSLITSRRYSDVLAQQLSLPADQVGNRTPTGNACQPSPTSLVPTNAASGAAGATSTPTSASRASFVFPTNATYVCGAGCNSALTTRQAVILSWIEKQLRNAMSVAEHPNDPIKDHCSAEALPTSANATGIRPSIVIDNSHTKLSWEQLNVRNISSAEAVKPAPIAIPPPSDSWRETIRIASRREGKQTIQTTSAAVSDATKWTSSIQALEGTSFVAVGSASDSGSLTILENTLPTSATASSGKDIQLRSVFSAPHPIYSISAMGNKLITAGPQSRVQVFQINSSEMSQRGKGLEHVGECALGPGKLEEVKISPPGMRGASVRVQYVEFMPINGGRTSNPTKFLALEEKNVHIWDLEANKVVGRETVSRDQLTSASWSIHAPGSLLATAGVDHNLYVLDSRQIGMDTNRATLSWSNTHANVLATGSDDNLWRAWSIDSTLSVPRVPAIDMFIGCPGTEWGDPSKSTLGFGTTGAKAAKSGLCVGGKIIAEHKSSAHSPIVGCTNLSVSGEISFHTFTENVFQHVSPQRYLSDHYPQECEIERAVHSRNLKKGFSAVVQLSRASLAANRTVGRTERLMIELCTAKQPIDASAWSIPPILVNKLGDTISSSASKEESAQLAAEAIHKFRTDVDSYSYFLPPNFGHFKQWYDMVPSQCRLEFEMVVLRFNILVDVLKGNWETILKAEKMICKGMETDTTFMEPDTLKLLIEAVLPNDFIKGLAMGIHFAEVIEDLPSSQSRFFELAGLFHLLLFPTVYDPSSWLVEPSNIEKTWRDGRGMIRRQAWLREYLDYLQNKSSDINSHNSTVTSPTDGQIPLLSVNSGRARPSISVDPFGLRPRNSSISTEIPRGRSPSVANVGKTTRSGKMSISLHSPTVLEVDETEKLKDAMESQVANSKAIIAMARTELALIRCLQKSTSNDTVAENIIKIVTGEELDTHGEASGLASSHSLTTGIKSNYRPTISATSNRLYLDALLITKRYEEYFQICFDFISTYVNFDFSKTALWHAEKEGMPRLKVHVDNLYGTASSHLADAIALATKAADPSAGTSTSVVGQTMTGGTKALRDGLAIVAKIGTIMAQTMEIKGSLDKEGVEGVARCIGILNSLLGQLGTSMFKILDAMERMLGKTGTSGAYARDAASLTIEDIRQSCRGFQRPTDGKTRAFSAALSAATGASVRDSASGNSFIEEVFLVVDKLAKGVGPFRKIQKSLLGCHGSHYRRSLNEAAQRFKETKSGDYLVRKLGNERLISSAAYDPNILLPSSPRISVHP